MWEWTNHVSQTEIISKLSKYFLKSHWCSTGHLLSTETASVLYSVSARFLSGFVGLRKINERREWAAAGCPKVTLSPRVSHMSAAERQRSHRRKRYLYLLVCKRLRTHACTPTHRVRVSSVWIFYEHLVWQSACCYLLAQVTPLKWTNTHSR